MSVTVFLTGATGFLGSHIADYLLRQGYSIIATRRKSSNNKSCLELQDKVEWVNVDDANWENDILQAEPKLFIHAAWAGTSYESRSDWDLQLDNYLFSKKIFELAEKVQAQKVIAFGSQSEYGIQKEPADEETCTDPADAYGAFKVLTSCILRNMFNESGTEWYWLRLYSVFGDNENPNSLVSTVINKMLDGESIELTLCEQRYNYIHIDSLLPHVYSVLANANNNSGVYNLCSSEAIILKDLLLLIASLMGKSPELYNFGGLPYRHNQPMVINGSNAKYIKTFNANNKIFDDIEMGIEKIIQNHKTRTK